MKLRYRGWLVCLFCGLTWLAPAEAQYPNRSARIVVPFPPGGGTDTMARAMGNRLGEALGQQIVVDNRAGGGANIGAEVAGYETTAWYGLLAPTGTPQEAIARVNAETGKVLKLPDVKARLDATGMVPEYRGPEELGRKIQEEVAKWGKVVKALHLSVN